MGFEIKDLGDAASTYLGLLVLFNVATHYVLFKMKSIKHVYMAIWFYGMVRMGGQVCGVVFAIKGYGHYEWLIAYIVLSVEGYFLLVLASVYIVIRQENTFLGSSVLEYPLSKKKKTKLTMTPRRLVRYLMIVANALLVAGSVLLSGMTVEEIANNPSQVNTSKVLRTIGQAIFLSITVAITGYTIYQVATKTLVTPAMWVLIAAAPFLWVRGVYGILSIFIDLMNYLVLTNYLTADAYRKMTIFEYVLGTTMEFVAAVLLLYTFKYRNRNLAVLDSESNDLEKALTP